MGVQESQAAGNVQRDALSAPRRPLAVRRACPASQSKQAAGSSTLSGGLPFDLSPRDLAGRPAEGVHVDTLAGIHWTAQFGSLFVPQQLPTVVLPQRVPQITLLHEPMEEGMQTLISGNQ